MRQGIAVLAIASLVGVSTASAADPQLKTDEEKTLYALGVAMSQSLAPLSLTPAEIELVKAGFADGVSNKKPQVDMKTFGPKVNEFAKARVATALAAEKQLSQAFLEKAAAEKGADKKPSGLIYTELKAGDGRQPKPNDMVKVNYTGTLRDGTVFDSSAERGQPGEFAVHGVIPCWAEALQLMKVHGKAKVVCPPELAYGDKGAPPRIKPGAALVFEIELLEVSPGSAGEHGMPPHGMPEHGMPEEGVVGHEMPAHGGPAGAEPTPGAEGAEKKQ
ncbi:MAG TPA: FKBP-type peptidyl-prolyl cis-trans isomerase [Candidatus Margulisiibacteriota bacterium]|nr:FKBP-type peptidyl-prolyl cis-trans isomerase [Candidatus Margulisiibacteriota bacterium]